MVQDRLRTPPRTIFLEFIFRRLTDVIPSSSSFVQRRVVEIPPQAVQVRPRRLRQGVHAAGTPHPPQAHPQGREGGWPCTKGGVTFIISAATTLPGLGLERPPPPHIGSGQTGIA